MSETVIPQSTKQHNPGKNQKYVNSRGGEPAEAHMTKNASMKHHNPEFFKRQTDRASNENIGRGVGHVGVRDGGPGSVPSPGSSGKSQSEINAERRREEQNKSLSGLKSQRGGRASEYEKPYGTKKKDNGPGANGLGPDRSVREKATENVGRGVGETGKHIGQWDSKKKDSIPARKDVPIQRDFNKHQPNVGNDPGRGPGRVGVDNRARVHSMDNNNYMVSPKPSSTGQSGSSNPIRKSASASQTNLPGGKKTDQNQMQMKQFTRGTMY
jgi:hypothetical protein